MKDGHFTREDIPNLPDDWYIEDTGGWGGDPIWVGTKSNRRCPTPEEIVAIKEALKRSREAAQVAMWGEIRYPVRV